MLVTKGEGKETTLDLVLYGKDIHIFATFKSCMALVILFKKVLTMGSRIPVSP